MDPSPPPRTARSHSWFLIMGAVLTLTLALLMASGLAGFFALSGLRAILVEEAEYFAQEKDGVAHLHRYALTGEAQNLRGFRAALAPSRAFRAPLRHAVESPGDYETFNALLRQDESIPGPLITALVFYSRFVGESSATRFVLDRWLESDLAMEELEGMGEGLAEAVEESGPGSEAAVAVSELIDLQDERVTETRADFRNSMIVWGEALERKIRIAFLLSGFFLFLLGLVVLIATVRSMDVADRLRRESESRFRQLAEGIREVFWLTDPFKHVMLYLSPVYEQVWGRPVDEVYRNPKLWMEAIHPDDRPRVERAVPAQLHGGYDITYRIERPDGQLRWIRDRAFPIQNEKAEVVRVAGIAEDITAQRDLEAELTQDRTLRSVGRLAGGVAHEFNNLLTAVQGHIQFALEEDNPGRAADLEAALDGTRKGAELTRRLLSLAGRQMIVPRRVELAGFLADSEGVFRNALSPRVELEVEGPPDLPDARMDPAHIREAVLNLLVNARDAMPAGGLVKIRCGIRRAESSPFLTLEVEDNGPGIPSGIVAEVFTPFRSDGGPDPSIALGLPAVHGIMKQSGGNIEIRSSEKGTVVTLLIPLWDGATASVVTSG